MPIATQWNAMSSLAPLSKSVSTTQHDDPNPYGKIDTVYGTTRRRAPSNEIYFTPAYTSQRLPFQQLVCWELFSITYCVFVELMTLLIIGIPPTPQELSVQLLCHQITLSHWLFVRFGYLWFTIFSKYFEILECNFSKVPLCIFDLCIWITRLVNDQKDNQDLFWK